KECFLLVDVVMAGNKYGAADGATEIVLLISGNRSCAKLGGVEGVVADEFVQVAMERTGARLGFDFYGSRTVAAVLRAEIRSQHFHFGNRVNARVNIQRGVAAVVLGIASIPFEVVVFRAATVDAVGYRNSAGPALVLAGLVGHSRRQRNQLRVIAPIQFQLRDFLARDRAF